MAVDRFIMEFNGKEYNAVEINGTCVGLDSIILAESSLNNAIEEAINENSNAVGKHSGPYSVDNQIFGFADTDLILYGTERELENYAKSLL